MAPSPHRSPAVLLAVIGCSQTEIDAATTSDHRADASVASRDASPAGGDATPDARPRDAGTKDHVAVAEVGPVLPCDEPASAEFGPEEELEGYSGFPRRVKTGNGHVVFETGSCGGLTCTGGALWALSANGAVELADGVTWTAFDFAIAGDQVLFADYGVVLVGVEGLSPPVRLSTESVAVDAIAVVGAAVYWSDYTSSGNVISKAGWAQGAGVTDGGLAAEPVATLPPPEIPHRAFAADDDAVYAGNGQAFFRIDAATGDVVTLVTPEPSLDDAHVAVDDTHVYYGGTGLWEIQGLWRVPKTGGTPERLTGPLEWIVDGVIIGGIGESPEGLSIDDEWVYWHESSEYLRLHKECAWMQTVATTRPAFVALGVDDAYVYYAKDGRLMRRSKP